MRKLLVTGGAGFIGCNFVHHWIRVHPTDRVVVLDALTYAGNAASLVSLRDNPAFAFVHGDICDTDLVGRLINAHAIDTLVHFAAESHVDRSILGPDAFIKTNIVGTHSLLTAARKAWLQRDAAKPHRFHHVLTDEVYGSLGPDDPGFSEITPYAPNSPYSASKAASDHDCKKIEAQLGFVASKKLEDGLLETFRWFVQHEPWWRAIMDGSYQRWIDTQYSRDT